MPRVHGESESPHLFCTLAHLNSDEFLRCLIEDGTAISTELYHRRFFAMRSVLYSAFDLILDTSVDQFGMVSKKIALKSVNDSKYGSNHQGLFAVEAISKDEQIFESLLDKWPFYPEDDQRGKYTKEELLKLFEDKPQVKDFFLRQTYYFGNGQYNTPIKYLNEDFSNVEECIKNLPIRLFINHSCDPNVYFVGRNGFALRNISVGDEVTADYNSVEDENSLRFGLVCMCRSGDKCVKTLRMDKYRDPIWVKENEQFCLPYVQQRISELRKAGELP